MLPLVGWVLSHWAHFAVHRFFVFIFVYFVFIFSYYIMSYCNTEGCTWWDGSLFSFSTLTLLVGSSDL